MTVDDLIKELQDFRAAYENAEVMLEIDRDSGYAHGPLENAYWDIVDLRFYLECNT